MRLSPHSIALSLVALCTTVASAQETDRRALLDIERYRPAVDGTAGFAVSDPRGLGLGEFAVSLSLNDAIRPLVLQRESGERLDLVTNRFGAVLSALVGVGGPVSLGLDLPFVLYQEGSLSALPQGARPTASGVLGAAAMGDLRIAPRLSLLREKDHGVDLAVDAALSLPTGDETAFSGDDGFGGQASVGVAKAFGDVRVLGQLGMRFRPAGDAVRVPVGSELLVRAAGVYTLSKSGVLRELIGEIDAGTLVSDLAGNTTPAEWRVGGRLCALPNFPITLGAGGGLSSGYGTPFARLNAGIGYDPRACTPTDADGDGVSDTEDACPTVAGVKAHEGCPPPVVDSDGDGLLDPDDACPNEKGVAEHKGCLPPPPPDQDADGVADADDACVDVAGVAAHKGCPPPPPDTDGDGILDADDACVDKAGVAAHKGCPIPDQDADGILDDDDACPTEAGLAERNGCPVRDADKDGVEDHEDRCPNEPGEKDRFGCPVKDGDADGVSDDEDNCPAEKGTKANHGCKAKQLVVIKKDKIEILDKVLFATGKASIDKKSFKLLDNVASVIVSHPEIPKIRVEGHTDNVGDAGQNKALSQARAEAVVEYLVKKGVDAAKLVPAGFGQEQPIAPNATKKGKEANRRVEFRVVQPELILNKPKSAADLPLEPIAPAPQPEPVKPAEPAPASVVEPVKPAAPAPVVAPVKPAEPAPVVEPVKPAEPAPVVAPVKPAEPAAVVEPVKPAAPAPVVEPVKPAAPAEQPMDELFLPPLEDLPPLPE